MKNGSCYMFHYTGSMEHEPFCGLGARGLALTNSRQYPRNQREVADHAAPITDFKREVRARYRVGQLLIVNWCVELKDRADVGPWVPGRKAHAEGQHVSLRDAGMGDDLDLGTGDLVDQPADPQVGGSPILRPTWCDIVWGTGTQGACSNTHALKRIDQKHFRVALAVVPDVQHQVVKVSESVVAHVQRALNVKLSRAGAGGQQLLEDARVGVGVRAIVRIRHARVGAGVAGYRQGGAGAGGNNGTTSEGVAGKNYAPGEGQLGVIGIARDLPVEVVEQCTLDDRGLHYKVSWAGAGCNNIVRGLYQGLLAGARHRGEPKVIGAVDDSTGIDAVGDRVAVAGCGKYHIGRSQGRGGTQGTTDADR